MQPKTVTQLIDALLRVPGPLVNLRQQYEQLIIAFINELESRRELPQDINGTFESNDGEKK